MLANLHVAGDLAALVRDYLLEMGCAGHPLYQRLCLQPPSSRMTFTQWWQLLDDVQAIFPGQPVGLLLGQRVKPAHVGVLGYLTLACDNVAQAMQRFERFQRLLHDGDRASVELHAQQICMAWGTDFGPSTRLSDEVLISGLLTFLRMMTGDNTLRPLHVRFMFSAPADVSVYRDLASDISFNAPRTEIHFPVTWFAKPISNSDPALQALLEQQAETLLSVLPGSGDFLQKLQSALLRCLQNGDASCAAVAGELHMSERSLFRKLAGMQIVFKDFLNATRMGLAKRYLQEGSLTHSEIALLLGYSEQSAFSRAFKKASGCGPKAFQKTLNRP